MGKFKITDLRKQRAESEAKRKRMRRIFLWSSGALVLLGGLTFFVAPPILKAQLQERLAKELDRKVEIDAVSVNPFRVSAQIKGMRIEDKDGKELLGWGSLFVNLNLTALCFGELRFDAINLAGLSGRVLLLEEGKLSVADIIERHAQADSSAPNSSTWAVILDALHVEGARIYFEDRSQGELFTTAIGPLSFDLRNFALRPESSASYEFTASAESGESLTWRGKLGMSPFRSSGELAISGVPLAKYAPYHQQLVKFKVTEGRFSLGGHYEVALHAQGVEFNIKDGHLELDKLALVRPGISDPFVVLNTFAAKGITADSKTKVARVESVQFKGLGAAAVINRDGTLDLLSLVASGDTPPKEDGDAVFEKWIPLSGISAVMIEDSHVLLRDERLGRPAVFELRGLTASVNDLSLRPGAVMQVRADLLTGPEASVGVGGAVSFFPLQAKLDWSVNQLALAPFSPYLEEGLRARLVQGKLTGKGSVRLESHDAEAPTVSASGSLGIERFSLVDEKQGESLVGFEALSINGASVDTRDAQLQIDELILQTPTVAIAVNKAGELNLAGVLRQSKTGEHVEEVVLAAPPKKPFDIRVGALMIDGAKVSLSDASVSPALSFSIRDFGGNISGLDTRDGNPAKFALGGNLEGSGRILLEGSLLPFGPKALTDLKLGVDSLNLVAFSPYSGKYAGYALESGRFNLSIALKLKERMLESENVMTLDHFNFGAQTDSAEATKLPVRLAVALLKDRQGKIRVDLPVQGNLDDPEFKVGRVVWSVIGNILTKAATSPFALLGAAFGGGPELSSIDFEMGTATLAASEAVKIQTLQKAFSERPELGVSLVGNYDPVADTALLRSLRFEQLVRTAVWQAKSQTGETEGVPSELVISDEERRQTVLALYTAKYGSVPSPASSPDEPGFSEPTLKTAIAPKTASTPEVSTAGKQSSPGFFARVFAYITGRKATLPKEPLKREKSERSGVKGRVYTQAGKDAPMVEVTEQVQTRPVIGMAEQVRVLSAEISIEESDLTRLALDRAQLIEQQLIASGVAAARISVEAPSAGLARVQLKLR